MIELIDLTIEFPNFSVSHINLRVAEGEFFALLGPTGAGKTLVLEAIAGVAPVTRGSILVRGVDVTRTPPEKRNVGIVYQDLGLFPHMNALENIRYGLKYHGGGKADRERSARVDELIGMLGLDHLTERSVHNLSGGEKQRIALARCLAVNPSLVLLDEPLSALDANKRDEVLLLLKGLHENLKTTFLMVTHEFSQVMFLAQRAAIINAGRIEQVGEVSDVFRKPETQFVAEFVGMKNLWSAIFRGDTARVGDVDIRLSRPFAEDRGFIGVRPEHIRITSEPPTDSNANIFAATVIGVWNVGPYYELTARADGVEFRAYMTEAGLPQGALTGGDRVYVAFDPESAHALGSREPAGARRP